MKAILTFHSVDDSGSVLSYAPARFRYLLETLSAKRIPVVGLRDLLSADCQTGVALTFDDGMRSVLENALPVLKDHDARAHLFVTTNAINSGDKWPEQPASVPGFDMLDWDGIDLLQAGGISIDAHTCSHPDLRTLSEAEILDECERANDEISKRTGRRPLYFAYPFGYHNARAREVCSKLYDASVTTELGTLSGDENYSALPRLDTYYLQTDHRINAIDSASSQLYFRFRWLLRTLRGTHCTANSDS